MKSIKDIYKIGKGPSSSHTMGPFKAVRHYMENHPDTYGLHVTLFGSLAATGIATLATGGTTAPALVTTAAGAALSAVHDATNLSVSNLPPTSSDSPYDDTVNGGLRDIVLYRPKAVRYAKDEAVSGGTRAQTMGTFSYATVSTLSTVSKAEESTFVSVYDIQLPMAGGMTKAEHDKIVALLQKGVYI